MFIVFYRSAKVIFTKQKSLLPQNKKKKLSEKAMPIWQELSKQFSVDFDDAGSIGKRYRREDEIVIVVRQKAQTKDNQSVVVFEDEAFRQFCVEHFDADRNGMITDSEVSSVDSLSVPSMEIVSLKGIEAFASLRKLYCYDNKIEALDLSANGELTVLGCHYNDLEELSLSANTKLTSLNCNHNRISKLDLSALTELRELHVQYNELGELDLSGNPRLGILQCMENRLTELDITKCPDLTMLWADPMPTLETLYWTQAQADNMFALIFVPESTEKVVRE